MSKTFTVTERYIMEDTWIVEAKDDKIAIDIAMTSDPDKSELKKVIETNVEEND